MLNQANDFKGLQMAVECTQYADMLANVRQTGAENEVESRGKTLGKSHFPNLAWHRRRHSYHFTHHSIATPRICCSMSQLLGVQAGVTVNNFV
jgi:hypothetical protein